MARNRKNQAVVERFAPVLKVFLLCAFVAAAALGYVWQKSQVYRLAERQKRRENELEEFRRQNEALGRTWALLQSPDEIDARVRRMGLDLAPPEPDQIVRLVENPPRVELSRDVAEHFLDGNVLEPPVQPTMGFNTHFQLAGRQK